MLIGEIDNDQPPLYPGDVYSTFTAAAAAVDMDKPGETFLVDVNMAQASPDRNAYLTGQFVVSSVPHGIGTASNTYKVYWVGGQETVVVDDTSQNSSTTFGTKSYSTDARLDFPAGLHYGYGVGNIGATRVRSFNGNARFDANLGIRLTTDNVYVTMAEFFGLGSQYIGSAVHGTPLPVGWYNSQGDLQAGYQLAWAAVSGDFINVGGIWVSWRPIWVAF